MQQWHAKGGATMQPPMTRVHVRSAAVALICSLLCGCYTWLQPMPDGTSFIGPERPVGDVRFLTDLTWVADEGVRHVDQSIFDAVFELIGRAEYFVVIDMFLWDDFQGDVPETTRALSAELTAALIGRKRERPEIEIVAISLQLQPKSPSIS